MSSSAGLRDVIAGQTTICTLDGLKGELSYRGIPIQELAEHGTFEEIAYLLWIGRLPRVDELAELRRELAVSAVLPDPVLAFLRSCSEGARPMDVLRTAVSALGIWDPDSGDNSEAANRRKSVRLTAQIPLVISAFHRLRTGRETVPADPELTLAGNLLYTLSGERPSAVATRSLDVALILHADHEFNASTFAARVTIATLSDVHAAVTSAVGTLSGPLHGGANEAVFRMLEGIPSAAEAERWVRARLEARERIMGFGHAVYKTLDPRATQLHRMARALAEDSGNSRLFEISETIERLMLAEKKLNANVDFYSATVYHVLGIPTDLFTPVFAASRVTGWTAHILEQLADNRIIRPRGEYVGPVDQHYVPIEAR